MLAHCFNQKRVLREERQPAAGLCGELPRTAQGFVQVKSLPASPPARVPPARAADPSPLS